MARDYEGGVFEPGPRVLAFLGALATGAYLAAVAGRLVAREFPVAAAVLALSAAPFILLLAGMALAPARLQALLSRVSAVDLSEPRHVFAVVIVAATLFILFGLNSFVEAAYLWESVARHGESLDRLQDFTAEGLLQGLLFQFLFLTLPPLVWLTMVNGHGAEGVAASLGLTPRDAGGAALLGAGIAVGAIVALAAVAYVAQAAGVAMPENQRALAIARVLTVPTAIMVALLSSVGEEVFFRGFLQPRLGLWGQAALFSVAHVGYLNALQIVVTFVLGLAFGVALRRSKSLVAPISGHFAFNLIMILIVVLAPEAA